MESSQTPVVRVPSFRQLFDETYAFWKENVWHLALVTVVGVVIAVGPLILVLGVPALVLRFSWPQPGVLLIVGILALCALVWMVIAGSAAKIMLILASFRGKSASIQELLNEAFEPELLGRFILGSVLMGILVMLGFMVFVIPGIILLVPAAYFPYLLVKEKKPVVETITASWNFSRGFWWVTFLRMGWLLMVLTVVQGFIVAVFMRLAVTFPPFIALAGLLGAGFAVLVTVPMIMVMTRRLYEVVSGFKAAHASATHKLSGGEVGQVVALILLWIIAQSVVGSIRPHDRLEPVPHSKVPTQNQDFFERNAL